MKPRIQRPKTIDEFVKIAEAHGAHVERDTNNLGEGKKLTFACSPPSGDCGSSGCRCSPGLWVGAYFGKDYAVATWGTNENGDPPTRGDEAYWEDEDANNWRKVRNACGVS